MNIAKPVRAAFYLRVSTDSERTIAGLKVARAKGKRLGRPPLPELTIRTVLTLNQYAGIGARKIATSTGFPLGTVSAILTRSRQGALQIKK
jgi:DNA invertase Pin-like site-specific DNA recombinase